MKARRVVLLIMMGILLVVFAPMAFAGNEPTDTIPDQARCSVCGMFVAKYPNWLAQIQYPDPAQTRFFDGVKDMMVFYFNPEQYNGPSRETIRDLFVKDYYSLNWLSATEAYYVIGSDIYGPMGHELIPFETRGAAETFSKDHHGKEILTFEEITPELIESLREGQRMR
jgi:copper chaperone NosL